MSDLSFLSVGSGALGRAFRRFSRGINRCLPRPLRLWLGARHPTLVLSVGDQEATLFRDIGGERKLLGTYDPSTDPLLLKNLVGRRPIWGRVEIELPAEDMLTRTLVLPVQVRKTLHKVLSYELDRMTPFDPSEVYFDACAVSDLAQGSRIRVQVAMVRRALVDGWVELLREAQVPATVVSWKSAWPDANLLPASSRPRPRRLPLVLAGVLAFVAIALLIATLATPLWQRGKEQALIAQVLRRVSAQAAEVSDLRSALEQAQLDSVAVVSQKQQSPRVTDLLLELTELLPDDTWVQTLNYRDGEVDIRGESSQATNLIGLLERGPGISRVTFQSPVMQVANSRRERFHIAFRYQTPT